MRRRRQHTHTQTHIFRHVFAFADRQPPSTPKALKIDRKYLTLNQTEYRLFCELNIVRFPFVCFIRSFPLASIWAVPILERPASGSTIAVIMFGQQPDECIFVNEWIERHTKTRYDWFHACCCMEWSDFCWKNRMHRPHMNLRRRWIFANNLQVDWVEVCVCLSELMSEFMCEFMCEFVCVRLCVCVWHRAIFVIEKN